MQPKILHFGGSQPQLQLQTDKSCGSNSPKSRITQAPPQPSAAPPKTSMTQQQQVKQSQFMKQNDESFDDQTESEEEESKEKRRAGDGTSIIIPKPYDERQIQYNRNYVDETLTPQFKQQSQNQQQLLRQSTLVQGSQLDQQYKKSSTAPTTQQLPNMKVGHQPLAQQPQFANTQNLPVLFQGPSFGAQAQGIESPSPQQSQKTSSSTPNMQSTQRPSNLQQHPYMQQQVLKQPQQIQQPNQQQPSLPSHQTVSNIRTQLQIEQVPSSSQQQKDKSEPQSQETQKTPQQAAKQGSNPGLQTKKEESKGNQGALLPPKAPQNIEKESFPTKLTMIIKVKKETNEGQEKTQEVKFDFDFTKDTVYNVAAEMVNELDLGDHQIAEIQKQIIQQIAQKTGKGLVPQALAEKVSQLTKPGDRQQQQQTLAQLKTLPQPSQHVMSASPQHNLPQASFISPQTPAINQAAQLTTPANTPAQHAQPSQETFTQAQAQAQAQSLDKKQQPQYTKKQEPQKQQIKLNKEKAEVMFQKLLSEVESYYYDLNALGINTVEEIGEIMDCSQTEKLLRVKLLSDILMAKREYKKKSPWYQKRTANAKAHTQNTETGDNNALNPIQPAQKRFETNQQQDANQQINHLAIGARQTHSDSHNQTTPQYQSHQHLMSNPQDKQRISGKQHENTYITQQAMMPKVTFNIPQYIKQAFKSAPTSIVCSQKLSKDLKRVEAFYTEEGYRMLDQTPDDEVKELQQLLNILWYDSVLIHASKAGSKEEERNIIATHVPLKVDGIFDEKTEKCVIKFQKYKEKTDNGIVSERTWTLMLNQADSIMAEDLKKQKSAILNEQNMQGGTQQVMNHQKEPKQVLSSNHQGNIIHQQTSMSAQSALQKSSSQAPTLPKDSTSKQDKLSQPLPAHLVPLQPVALKPVASIQPDPLPTSPLKSFRPLPQAATTINPPQQSLSPQTVSATPSKAPAQVVALTKQQEQQQQKELDYKGMIDQLHEKIPEQERSKGFYMIHRHEEDKRETENDSSTVQESQVSQTPKNEEDFEGQLESPSQQDTNNLADDEYIDDDEDEEENLRYKAKIRNK